MKISRRCKCGCGKITNSGSKYIWGHNNCRKPFVRKIRRRCKCGCGGITNYGKNYICGHNGVENAGRNLSKDHKRKISLAHKGTGKTKIRRRCKCGCGGITNLGRIYISKHNRRGKKLSKEARLKQSISHIGMKPSEESKRKNSVSKKKNWQDPDYQKKMKEAFNLKPNKPEIKLERILNKLYPNEYKYVGDFQFWLGGKNPDFMNVNGQKKLIELYGDYWHKGQDPQDRIDHFKKYGFNTLVIWENELKESRLQLRRKLMDFRRMENGV